ncbi:MAG: 3-dehydroquinate synthase II [Methanomassiliicoccaceae archaeon]|nr:3-dehydroquinate synthase II [Methanomassiliicoccaceae archaeon]MCL2145733.1 3-dehydroquinate synthase II [Methanomassiliicoccaceae archaeon]
MKEIWMRADAPDDANERKRMLISGLESGIGTFIVRPGDESFSSLGKVRLIFSKDGILSGDIQGRMVGIASPEDQADAMDLCGREDVLVVSTGDWSVIPFENLIAASSGRTKIMACVSSSEDAELCRNILEKGTDGVVVDTDDTDAMKNILKEVSTASDLGLTAIEVMSVKNILTGDRVCIDTCSKMVPGEGMLIGSQSSCLFLVQSESEENGYVAARPFRVNAGAVHAYIMVPDGKTRYLSELRAGDDVLIVGRDGNTKAASIGRCKEEVRPMLIITASHDGKEYTTILQNAETVRLVTRGGSTAVSEIKKGDEVLAYLTNGGRHFGMAVDEKIKEI